MHFGSPGGHPPPITGIARVRCVPSCGQKKSLHFTITSPGAGRDTHHASRIRRSEKSHQDGGQSVEKARLVSQSRKTRRSRGDRREDEKVLSGRVENGSSQLHPDLRSHFAKLLSRAPTSQRLTIFPMRPSTSRQPYPWVPTTWPSYYADTCRSPRSVRSSTNG